MKKIAIIMFAFFIFSALGWANNTTGQLEIGLITLDPENPLLGDIVRVKAPIKLIYPTQLEEVYVVASVDDTPLAFFTLNFYYAYQEIPVQFVFNTEDYGLGNHEIRIDVMVDGKVQTRVRSFFIRGVKPTKQHCLSIISIQPLISPKAGKDTRIAVDIKNCGDFDEADIRTKMKGFGETVYDGIFFLTPGEIARAVFTVFIPEREDTETLTFTIWNAYDSATRKYDLVILTSKLFIDLEDEYRAEIDKMTKIKFRITNVGEVEGTFEIGITGEASNWMKITPEILMLEPHETREVIGYINVPEDVEQGYYSFTITENGKYLATSVLHVTKPWAWPMFPLTTKMFVGIWLGIILVILTLFLLITWVLRPRRKKEETF